jgi:P-type conjugative transfer protein TrbJ
MRAQISNSLGCRRIWTCVLVTTSALLLAPVCSWAQFGSNVVFDPSMFSRQLEQLQQEEQMVVSQAQELQNAINNTVGIGAQVYQSNLPLLNDLGRIIEQERGLAYTLTNLQSQFQQQFPGYAISANPNQQTQQNTELTLNTLKGTLESAQNQAVNFDAERAKLEQLASANASATGRLQAIQIGNEIALENAQQIQLLRQLVMAQTNAQNVEKANQINAEAAEKASTRNAILNEPRVPYGTTPRSYRELP